MLFDGPLAGNFIFFMRADDPSRRFLVLRKALYAYNIKKEGGSEELVHSRADIEKNYYGQDIPLLLGEKAEMVMCRMRSLGCSPCTGAIRSEAVTVPEIIAEMMLVRRSERENRVIDHDQEGSMELKKREGYF